MEIIVIKNTIEIKRNNKLNNCNISLAYFFLSLIFLRE